MPSRVPSIVQPSTMLIGLPIEYEINTPVTRRPAGDVTEQSWIITPASVARIPSSSGRTTRTWSIVTCCAIAAATARGFCSIERCPARGTSVNGACRSRADRRPADGGSTLSSAPKTTVALMCAD